MKARTPGGGGPGPDRRALIAGGAALAGLAIAGRAAAATRGSARIEALLARMSLDEKAGQLSCYSDVIRPPIGDVNPAVNARNTEQQLADIRAGRVGTLMNGVGVAGARLAQKTALEESRLGVPLVFAADVIHGFRTIFPIPLGEASAFDTDLAQRTARAAASEASAAGLHWTFAPMVDVARDQRWGRVAEGAGEDVFLGQLLAAARVRGFQGVDLTADDSLLATAKHFAAYGAVAAGLDYNAVELSEQTLREVHLPPFQSAFDSGALATMSAFNDINGVPSTANRRLLTGLLRDEWGFRGVVISDYTADAELVAHGFAADDKDAARMAILAGVDISLQSGLYSRHLPALIAEGAVPMAAVDQAVRRVLGLKEALGLFDHPYRSLDPEAERARTATPAARRLAREAATRSIVLLRNEGGLLPLPRSGLRLALIGPFGEDRDNLAGPWAFFGDKSQDVDLAAGLRAALADPAALVVAKGCDIEAPLPGGVAAAVAAASQADVVLLAIGEGQDMSGEAQSRTEVVVPAAQQALAEAVAATGKPMVVLLRHGRALALGGAVRDARAILATWFLGAETGHAVADVLFGAVNPSGRLPISFPQESGQQPYFYNHRSTGRPALPPPSAQTYRARWRSIGHEALYPFGHGLGYAPFEITDLRLSARQLAWSDTLAVRARVTNTGAVAGSHVAQLYVRDRVASRTRPVRELKGFRRVTLEPGQGRDVVFQLSRADLMFVGEGDRWTVEPGWFDLAVASAAVGGLTAEFELMADDGRG